MAKVGIDSFLLDCHTNDNISEIEAAYGVKGFAVVVRLWQKIYCEKGYYCEWVERSPLLFLANWFGGNSGVTVNLIKDIVSRCLDNSIFDAKMYEDYSILTSMRIQKQYFDVVKRREEILVKKEYLLVSVDKIKGIVYENDVSVCRNQKNVYRNGTSKVKESKVNKKTESVRQFEEFISAYPQKNCNRYLTETAYCDLIINGIETEDNLVACAENYAEACRINETPEKYIKNAENFLKEFVFEKYLPGKYRKPKKEQKNSFNDFEQNQYDFDALEKTLLGGE
ncbi:MAG: DUF4373 domain-containing protein [Eubacterium sp.]|nr:DUF4373 domain-containing protein [Eubacterium sp.]